MRKILFQFVFAIPDHPWVDADAGAAVNISMTVAQLGLLDGVLQTVMNEVDSSGEAIEVELSSKRGRIFADLTIGANLVSAIPLKANERLSNRGMTLVGSGFTITSEQAKIIGLGRVENLEQYIRPLISGRDIVQRNRELMAIDFFGLSIESVRQNFPDAYQWLYERVKPEREQNNRKVYRDRWWIYAEPRSNFRPALKGIARYIATARTAKHRTFLFFDSKTIPESEIVVMGLDDAYSLGTLSSRIHFVWALAAGSDLSKKYTRVITIQCVFRIFPFPLPPTPKNPTSANLPNN